MVANESTGDAIKPPEPFLWMRFFHFALVLAPPIFLISLLARYQIDLPVWDQWPQVDLLDKLFQGQLTFADIWRQHNEHRQPFPRLIMLGLAYLSHWNMSWELLFNMLAGAACFGVFGYQVLRTLKACGHPVALWIFPTLSLLIFSVAQFENAFWGFSINIYLHLLCVLAAIVLLANPVFSWPRFIGALLLAIVATYSAPTAFIIWPLGALLLLSVHFPRPNMGSTPVVLWLLVGITALVVYFIDFAIPAPLERVRFYREPVAYAHFVLNYLGAPLLRNEYAVAAGLIGLCAFFYIPWRLFRARAVSLPQLAPYLAIGFFVIGAALLAGVGRLGHGNGLDSRYVSVSLWFWAAILVLSHLWLTTSVTSHQRKVSGMAGELAILAAAMLMSSDILGLGWRFTGQPYWPWFGLICLGFVSYPVFTRNAADRIAITTRVKLFLVLMMSVLIAENSLREGGGEAIWYQHHYLGEPRNQVMSSMNPATCPDAPLMLFSPEFLPEQTRERLIVLARHKLAAYREH